jgi:hypothetical protein
MKKQHLNVVIQLMIWLALFILQIHFASQLG